MSRERTAIKTKIVYMNNANKSTLNPNQISTALWTLFAQIFAFKSLKNPSLNFSCF